MQDGKGTALWNSQACASARRRARACSSNCAALPLYFVCVFFNNILDVVHFKSKSLTQSPQPFIGWCVRGQTKLLEDHAGRHTGFYSISFKVIEPLICAAVFGVASSKRPLHGGCSPLSVTELK
jgi:hypothetical protein